MGNFEVITLLHRRIFTELKYKLKVFKLGYAQFNLLSILLREGEMTQDQLAGVSGADKGTISRGITRLEREGYIARERKRTDSRANIISPTPKALQLQHILDFIDEEVMNKCLENLSEDERLTLLELIKKAVSE